MTLAPGTRLGAYEIVAQLGAGGMGEVYRARDERLGREVAIKVLPAQLLDHGEARARFEREARAVAQLSHPNILAIHDVGQQEETAYAVMELLEGQNLRERLGGGPLPVRKAVEYAVQIAEGLAAAHGKGVVHRDLKPENVFLTAEGRIKILDFGLARQTPPPDAQSVTESPTLTHQTEPGTVLGTAAYMSPEQVRGLATDHRSDIFSFGAVLYEMLSGRRPFARETAAESMAAILNEDPPDLLARTPAIPPALARIVHHCLEKSPADRFQSARDLAFDLASLSEPQTTSGRRISLPAAKRRSWGVLGAVALAAVAGFLAANVRPVASLTFRPLTFRRGYVGSARFMPDGETVVYGARWDGAPVQAFSTRLGGPESTALSVPPADILSVSRSGELLISLGRRYIEGFITSGRLARVPLSGGAPRELLEGVEEGAWTSDGEKLLVVRYEGDRCRMELGTGNVLYEAPGWISHARLSPRGDFVAFLDHPIRGADNGSLAVIPAAGRGTKKTLTGMWASLQGLAWRPDGREVWFTGAQTGWHSALYAATPAGHLRVVYRAPGRVNLQDIDPRGRVLLTTEQTRVGGVYGAVEKGEERDLSWLESSFAVNLTADGRKVVINEQGEGAGDRYGVYIRDTDGSPAVRLGDGLLGAFSPDGRFVATITMEEPSRMAVLPTGAGEARTLPAASATYWSVAWFPDGRRLVSAGPDADHGSRLYVQDLSGGPPRPFTGEGFGSIIFVAVSPDGKWAAAVGPNRMPFLCPTEGGQPGLLPGLQPGDGPMRFSADGRSLFLARSGETSSQIVRFDLARQTAEIWRELRPRDPHGVLITMPTDVTPDGRHYLYTYIRQLSDLFLVEGLR